MFLYPPIISYLSRTGCHLSSIIIIGKTTWSRHAFSRLHTLPDGDYKKALLSCQAFRFRIAFDEGITSFLPSEGDYGPILGKEEESRAVVHNNNSTNIAFRLFHLLLSLSLSLSLYVYILPFYLSIYVHFRSSYIV